MNALRTLSAHSDALARRISPWLVRAIILLLVAMPFHAFVVTVLSSVFGHQLYIASWKEVLQLGIIAGVLCIALTQRSWQWLGRGTNRAFLIACVLGLIASVLGQEFGLSWLAGVKTTILPLVLFVAVQPLVHYLTDRKLAIFVLIPAVIVAFLALVQFLVVPTALLTSLGYNATTILPYQGVHPGFEYARSFSTLGGPNQLGTYLILPAIWLLSIGLSHPVRRMRVLGSAGAAIVLAGIVVSFSRSALLGLMAAILVLGATYVPARWRWTVAVGAGLLAWFAWMIIMQTVSNAGTAWSSFLLRGSLGASGIVGGDSGHIQSVVRGLELLLAHPFGLGIGSAGPASFYNAQPLLTENWWLQIGLELGIPGLLAVVVGWGLMFKHWLTHLDKLDRVMLASFCGLAVSSLFLHTFADSTLACITMIMAGLVYARHWSAANKGPQE